MNRAAIRNRSGIPASVVGRFPLEGEIRLRWARRSGDPMPFSDNLLDAWMEALKAQHPECDFFVAVIEVAPPKPIWKVGFFWLAVVITALLALGVIPVAISWWKGLCQ